MDPNQLDLSKFPHIVKPSEMEDKEEIEKRSAALKQIKDTVENLTSQLDAYVVELVNFDSKVRILNQREYELKEQQFAVNQKEKEVYSREDDLAKEKEYVILANEGLKEREAKILQDKDYLQEIEIAKKEWEDRKAEVIKQEAVLEEKLKLKVTLERQKEQDLKEIEDEKSRQEKIYQDRKKELDDKESLIEKSNEIDSERKHLLDVREERIKTVETRLNLDHNE